VADSFKDIRTLLTLIGVAMALFMGALENTVIGTAMPTVVASLGGIEIYSWVFAAYILAATVMTPIWGKMADLVGRRPAMFGGLALFILGSALSGAAQSMPQLIAFRIVQGLGAAALFPIGMTIAADLLTLEQRTKVIGLFSGMWGVATLMGPLVGGYLTAYTRLSWRWCFYIILPFGLAAGAMIFWTYPERFKRRPTIQLDYAGTFTLTAFLVLLLVIIERGSEFSLALNLTGISLCVALAAIFVLIERSHAEPLMPLSIFQNRVVTIAALHGMFAMMALLGTMSYLPLFVQAVIGTNAAAAGRILIPFIIPWVLSSIIGGRLILRFGYRPLVLTGMISMLIGSVMLAQVSPETTRLRLSFDVIFLGMGGGLTMATMTIAAQHAVPPTRLGITTSTVQFARSIGAAFGTAIMGALMSWRLSHLLAGAPAEIAHLANQSEIGSIVRPESRRALSPLASAFLQQSLAYSLRLAFSFVLVASLIGLIIALFVPGGSAHDLAHPEEI
jgi:EmrB/QacA subfamily drug resistance transporter